MESPIHSSFIPTQDARPSVESIEYGKSAGDIFVLLGLISVVVAGAVSAGVFLYSQYAVQQLDGQKAQLQIGEKQFSTDAVNQLQRLDERLRLAEGILGTHTAPSVLFAILQETTLQSVQFTSLDYAQGTPSEIKVNMKGRAKTVNAIALQANMFSRHAAIRDPIFQINEFTKDGVTFTVTMMLNADVVRFQSLVRASQVARPQQAQQESLEGNDFSNDAQPAPQQSSRQQPARQTPPARPTQPTSDVPDGFGDFNE